MEDVVETKVAGLTVRIDRLLCVGFGDCIEVAPDLFYFDDDGIAAFVDPLPDIERDRLVTSCDICPVDALSIIVHKDDGKPGAGFRPYALEMGFDAPLSTLQRQVFEAFSSGS